MISAGEAVVGIDVGGDRKGFHAVALRDGVFDKTTSMNPAEILGWCLARNAVIVAVDAPCGWSLSTSSRLAERALKLAGKKIHCFATPTRALALAHTKGFYDWVFSAEKLYQLLARQYSLFDGILRKGPICIETFPHAIVCALAGKVVAAKPKTLNRRKALRNLGYDDSPLPNIDFVDAALCAVTAEAFRQGHTLLFGDEAEGFIVVPGLGPGLFPANRDAKILRDERQPG
jgi:predicted RNase H-like nuclease